MIQFQKRHNNNNHNKIHYWLKWIKCQLAYHCVTIHRSVGHTQLVHTYQIQHYKIYRIHGFAIIASNPYALIIRPLLHLVHHICNAKCIQMYFHSRLLKIAITLASPRHLNWLKCSHNLINRITIITCNRWVLACFQLQNVGQNTILYVNRSAHQHQNQCTNLFEMKRKCHVI